MIGSVRSPLCFKPRVLPLKFTKNEQFLPDLRRLSSACSALLLCLPQGWSHSPAVPYREHRDASSENSIHPSLLPKQQAGLKKCLCTEISCYDKKKTIEFSPVFPLQQAVKTTPLLNFYFSLLFISHVCSFYLCPFLP